MAGLGVHMLIALSFRVVVSHSISAVQDTTSSCFEIMPPLFIWGRYLRPLSPGTHSISACLRALYSRSAPQASSHDTTIVSQQKEQLQHQHEARDSQKKRQSAREWYHRQILDPEYCQRKQQYAREWYRKQMLDPEYRQRKQQYQKERYHKQMLDPEYRQKRAEVSRKFYADRRRDIEWFRQHVYAANKRFHDRIFADDAMRQNKNAYSAKWSKQRYCADPQFRLYHGLKKWYRLQREHLSQFVWEHWRPIYHQDKVERTCATCATTRINGSRLWVRMQTIMRFDFFF